MSVLNPDGTTTVSIQPPVVSDPGPSPPVFDRGQVTSRPGGVEPLRSTPPGPCDLEMTVARSDTALLQTPVNVCAGARISWRQLK